MDVFLGYVSNIGGDHVQSNALVALCMELMSDERQFNNLILIKRLLSTIPADKRRDKNYLEGIGVDAAFYYACKNNLIAIADYLLTFIGAAKLKGQEDSDADEEFIEAAKPIVVAKPSEYDEFIKGKISAALEEGTATFQSTGAEDQGTAP
jgi:hypothetical protein